MVACAEEIRLLAASIHGAEARLAQCLAEFAAGEGWVGSGIRSLAHWLTLQCGFTASEARQRCDLAARSRELPRLFEAFGSGAFSVGSAQCAQRVATPANDAEVTRVALTATSPQAARTYAAFRNAVAAERRHGERGADGNGGAAVEDEPLSPGADDPASSNDGDVDTWLRMWWDEYQYLRIDGRLDTTDGAALKALLDAIRHDAENADRATRVPEPDPVDCDDAGRVDPQSEDGPGRPGRSGDLDGDGDSDRPGGAIGSVTGGRRLSWIDAFSRLTRLAGDALVDRGVRGRWEDRFAVSVVIDVEVLLGARDGCGVLDDGASVARETVWDWLPASTLEGLVARRGAPLFMGRKVRVPNRATKRALKVRDGGCAFPGCGCTEFLDAHHLYGWCNGASTDVDELVLLCRRHHRLFHAGEYSIVMIDGHPRFVSGVLSYGLPPPESLGDLQGDGRLRSVEPGVVRRCCEPLTHYAKDVFVTMLLGATPD